MVGKIIKKELLETFSSSRFNVIFVTCVALVVLSVLAGARDYRHNQRQFEVSRNLMRDTAASQVSYQALGVWGSYKVYKRPAVLSSLVQGLESNLGRSTIMSIFTTPQLLGTRFNEEPVYAIFGPLDLFFVVNAILTLLALVFTYDAISGERENGTLKQIMASPISRRTVIMGKLIGSLLGLVLPLLAPLCLGVLLLQLMPSVDLGADGWSRLVLLLLLILTYLVVFLALGLFVSASTQRSSTSFLILLVLWVGLTLVVPRAAVVAAAELSPVPTGAEVEASKGAIDRQWYRESAAAMERWLRQNPGHETVPIDVQGRMNGELQRKADAEKMRVEEAYQSAQERRLSLARWLSRLSPTGCFTHAALALAETDIEKQQRFLQATREYRSQFQRFVGEKMKEERRNQVLGIEKQSDQLDLTGMPEFGFQSEPLGNSLQRVLPDLMLMMGFAALFFAGGFVSFLRYDVR